MRAAAQRLIWAGAQDTDSDAGRRAEQQQSVPGNLLSSLSRHSTALVSSCQHAPQGWQFPSLQGALWSAVRMRR